MGNLNSKKKSRSWIQRKDGWLSEVGRVGEMAEGGK